MKQMSQTLSKQKAKIFCIIPINTINLIKLVAPVHFTWNNLSLELGKGINNKCINSNTEQMFTEVTILIIKILG